MSPDKNRNPTSGQLWGRFAHLLSAQGWEGLLSALFFIYLAWLDKQAFGEVMYAIAAGSLAKEAVRFGLYYPTVARMGRADGVDSAAIVRDVNWLKTGLLVLVMGVTAGVMILGDFSPRLVWIVCLVCLGFGLEAQAETFFSDMRMDGRQDREARIRSLAVLIGYGYGLASAALGWSPVLISLFMVLYGGIMLVAGMLTFARKHPHALSARPVPDRLKRLFTTSVVYAVIDNLGTLYNRANVFFLEKTDSIDSVAVYSAAWNIVDSISRLVSVQFLGWVVFPVLATLWWNDRDRVRPLMRTNTRWMLVIAFPLMFVLHEESALIIRALYPDGFDQAVPVQRYLVWAIPFTFLGNLFGYFMITTGALRHLFMIYLLVTVLNLVFNALLVPTMGLAGACLVIVLTKGCMTILTFSYCVVRHRLLHPGDIFFPLALAGGALAVYALLSQLLPMRLASLLTLALYGGLVWKPGLGIMDIPGRQNIPPAGKPG